jgi:hypothetical protein
MGPRTVVLAGGLQALEVAENVSADKCSGTCSGTALDFTTGGGKNVGVCLADMSS